MSGKLVWNWVWPLIMLLAMGCRAVTQPTAEPTTVSGVGLPNPASVYCEEQGYRLEMRQGEGGTYGVCIFSDGSQCDEWAFFRGECGPAAAPTPAEDAVQPEPAPAGWGTQQIEVIILESFPVQVQVRATGTLPDSCSVIERADQHFSAESRTFQLELIVVTTAETGCVTKPVPFEETVELDVSGLAAGGYFVTVGNLTTSFSLAADNLLAEEAAPPAAEATIPEMDISDWPMFTNPTYGFSFRFPPDWIVTEETNPIHTLFEHQLQITPLGGGEVVFTVAYKSAGDEMRLTRSGMREGEMVEYGSIPFMGEAVTKTRLEFEGKVMGVYYDGAAEVRRDPSVYTLALDFLGDSRTGSGIPSQFEQYADIIVASFSRTA